MRRFLLITTLITLLLTPALLHAQEAPVISAITPGTYAVSNPTPITIDGQGFSPSAQVMMRVNGAYWAMRITNLSPTSATFIPPQFIGAGIYPVVVRTEGGDSNAVSLAVTQPGSVLPPGEPLPTDAPQPPTAPTLTDLSPAVIHAGTTPVVTVHGDGFTHGASVHLIVDHARWTLRTVAATPQSISFMLPSYVRPGSYPVIVRTSHGESNQLLLTVQAPTPTLTPSPVPTILPSPQPPSPVPRPLYAAFGDSVGVGFFSLKGYVSHFRDYLSARSGENIELRNLSQPGWTSTDLRNALQTNQQYRQAVSQASVVTWNIGGNDLRYARRQYQQGTCGGGDNQACLRQAVERLKANWSAIISEVLSLSQGQPKLIRTMDIYNPYVEEDSERDSWARDGGLNDYAVLKPYVDDANRYIAHVTTGNGLAYAPVYRTFNGPSGNEDPDDKGYISFDDFHPDGDGHRVIGQLLSAITP